MFSPSAKSIFQLLLCKPTGKYCKKEPVKGIRSDFIYTATEKDIDRITSDDNGGYFNSSNKNRTYYLKLNASRTTVEFCRATHTYDGKFYYLERNDKEYSRVEVDNENIFTLRRYYRSNKSIPGLRRVIFKNRHKGILTDYSYVIYTMEGQHKHDSEPGILRHGNSEYDRPYTKTTKAGLKDVDKLLSSRKSVDYIYNTILDNSGSPYLSTSQSHKPRNKKQICNRKHLIQLQEKGTVDKDELFENFKEMKKNLIVESLVFKQNSYYIFVSLLRVINDIKIFCSKDEKGSVLAVDTMCNLCNLWVTYTSYHNQRSVRTNTRKHPVFLGPLFFHFTKDVTTFP